MKKQNDQLAGRIFENQDYEKKDELSSGLAVTHEQVSDSMAEGTIDGVIEREDGTADHLGK
ncbi:YozQ family protein [Metabacillus sp. GX 13764]|uniref:YozQ family protein n=1 Tax=Metabacillus kandeliae TaxID=2900151 RepID=UPI001E3F4750|nr:YozQ family protein [Metabacillus kandeliae]MCD7035665.1 YozQ family protein [Metabacillus kandeliae]